MSALVRIWVLGCLLLCIGHGMAEAAGRDAIVIDSLKQIIARGKRDTTTAIALKDLAYKIHRDFPAEGKTYGHQSLALSKALNFRRGVSSAYILLGQICKTFGEYDSALTYIRVGGEIGERIGSRKIVFIALVETGSIYEEMGDYVIAMRATMMAKRFAEQENNKLWIAGCLQNMGIIQFKLGDFGEALKTYRQTAQTFKELGDERTYAGCLANMANAYLKLKQYDKALAMYNESVTIGERMKDKAGLIPRYTNIGSVFFFLEKYEECIQWNKKALVMIRELGDRRRESISYNNMGNAYRMLGNLKESEVYSLLALKMAQEMGAQETEMNAEKNLAETYAQMGNAERSLEHYKNYDAIRDTIKGEAVAAQIADMRIQFEAENNAQALELEQQKKEYAEAVAEKQALWLVVAGALVFGLLMTVVVLVLIQMSRKRQSEVVLARRDADFARKKADLEQRALRAQMNPHFIFNSLNALQRLYIEGDMERAGDYMADFARLLRKILDHSGQETIPIAEELDTLRLYMNLEKARLEDGFQYHIHVDEDLDIFNTKMAPLIIQPFLENAIWHGIAPKGGKGTIDIHLTGPEDEASDDVVVCTVTDDGIGIDTSLLRKGEWHESKGMRITQERLGPKGMMRTEELKEGGTRVTLAIPIEHRIS